MGWSRACDQITHILNRMKSRKTFIGVLYLYALFRNDKRAGDLSRLPMTIFVSFPLSNQLKVMTRVNLKVCLHLREVDVSSSYGIRFCKRTSKIRFLEKDLPKRNTHVSLHFETLKAYQLQSEYNGVYAL